MDNNISIVDESIFDNYNNYFRQVNSLKYEWMKALKNIMNHKTLEFTLSPEQESYIKQLYSDLIYPKVLYDTYQKAFTNLCEYIHISPNSEIHEIQFNKDRHNNTKFSIRYSSGEMRVKIPEGFILIHKSYSKKLKLISPNFRSGKLGYYMWPNKRIYFTIENPMPSSLTSVQDNDYYLYTPVDNYDYAFIDPSCSEFNYKAVYIKTDFPIEVKPYYEPFLGELSRAINYYHKPEKNVSIIVPKKDDNINESIMDIFKDASKWKTSNQYSEKHTFLNTSITDKEYSILKECLDKMKSVEDYKEYKKYFDRFCKFCHILPDGTVLYSCDLIKYGENYSNVNYIKVVYAYNTHKIEIDKNKPLYHISKVPNLRKLKPFFRSKTFSKLGTSDHQYFYSSPRIYFTFNNSMLKWFADYSWNQDVYKYVLDDDVKYCYVDPLVPSIINKAIYIETKEPLKVISEEDYNKRQSKNILKEYCQALYEYAIINKFTPPEVICND